MWAYILRLAHGLGCCWEYWKCYVRKGLCSSSMCLLGAFLTLQAFLIVRGYLNELLPLFVYITFKGNGCIIRCRLRGQQQQQQQQSNSNSANSKVKRCGEKTNAILLHFDVCTNVYARKFVRQRPAAFKQKHYICLCGTQKWIIYKLVERPVSNLSSAVLHFPFFLRPFVFVAYPLPLLVLLFAVWVSVGL